MKIPQSSLSLLTSRSGYTAFAIASAALAFSSASVRAASGTWNGTTSNVWQLDSNWSVAPFPSAVDTATFNNAGNGNTTIDVGTGLSITSILFDTASAAAYTIGSGGAGSQTLTLADTATVNMNATVANNQVFDSNIVLGTAIAGGTTITNLTTGVGAKNITINGAIQGGTGGTAGIKTISVSNLSGGSVTFTNAITAGGATGINLGTFQSANNDTTHTGTTTLSGNVSSSLRTLTATGGGSMVVDGQTVTVSTLSSYGNTTTYGKFFLNSGSVAFNGGYTTATSGGNPAGADGSALIVNGGTFSATAITLGRSQNTGSSTTFNTNAINMGNSGFQVNGGTANVTGAVRLYGGGSSTTGQVSGSGALTIGGELSIGEVGTRTTLLQVTGGTLTNTDAVGNGIVIGKGTAAAAAAGQLLLTGGTTTSEKISFGVSGGLAGSQGNLTLNGPSASLYVGSGGIVNNATNAYTTTINLISGTVGAKANWSSTLNMNLAGSGVTIKAADALNVSRDIALFGVLSGANGFTKTGAGTLTLSGTNLYTGLNSVTGGTLATSGTGTLGVGNVILADTTGVTLTLGSAVSFADTAALSFGSINSVINLNFVGNDVLGSITNGTLTISASTLTQPTTFTAGDLNTFFGGSNFTGTGTLTVVPEPSTYAIVFGGFSMLLCLQRGMRRNRKDA